MDVRYQVFVSSTYEDLQEERAEVIQAWWHPVWLQARINERLEKRLETSRSFVALWFYIIVRTK